uniref:OmpA family protein n=1 Tax=Novosphingobium sp. ZN18A2 TaxID=3079861 RepID=UPI00403FA3B4
MSQYTKMIAWAVGLSCGLVPALAMAQDATDLMSLDKGALKGEIQKRFDGAVAATKDDAVVNADSAAFMWASQAKAQCGIALGFLRSGTKDPVSIGKCAYAYDRMTTPVVASETPLPPPPPPPPPCKPGPYIVFFDWDSSAVTPEAAGILDTAVTSTAGCGSKTVKVDGYTDRSGSDAYNQGLSQRRADAVRDYLSGHGATATIETHAFGESNNRVPTADGVRELQNRRVEITVE